MQTQSNRVEVSYTDIVKLFGQTTAVQVKPPTNTSALIDSYVKQGSNRLSNDIAFTDKVSQEAAKQILVSNATTEYYKSQVNLDETIKQFLDSQYSPKTRQTYAAVLTKLTDYLSQHHIPLLDLTHKQASDFIHDLYDKYSPRYLRLIITTCGSLYKTISLLHPNLTHTNPFYSLRLPRIIDTYQKDWVTSADIETLKSHFKSINRLDLYALTHLLSKYGWRIGVLQTLNVNPTTLRYTAVSKGAQLQGKLTKTDYELLTTSNLLNTPQSTLTVMFSRHAKRLFANKRLSCSPSPHDLRRYHINSQASASGATEFLKVSAKYHKSPLTTLNYIDFA